jgi:SAM-dependent methyltransferase
VSQKPAYAFGDSELARERLGIVAATFAPPTQALLRDLPVREPRYVLDLGCGPGHTTALLADAFPRARLTGLDSSTAMIDDARGRVPRASFAVVDVTAPLRLPADVVYARLLLGHLPDGEAALATWSTALRPPGLLVCEEPVRYRSADDAFTRYEAAVTAVVAARGGTLWAAGALDHDPPSCERVLDRVVEHPVPVGRAAAMFWRNAVTWEREQPEIHDLITEFRELEASDPADVVIWELRQIVWEKRERGSAVTTRG